VVAAVAVRCTVVAVGAVSTCCAVIAVGVRGRKKGISSTEVRVAGGTSVLARGVRFGKVRGNGKRFRPQHWRTCTVKR
jgi:hypothetical protein